MRSTRGLLGREMTERPSSRDPRRAERVVGGLEGPSTSSEVSVDVLERETPGQHEHLHPIEELADLLRGPLAGLVLGGHPGLRGLLDDLLACGMHAVADRLDRSRPRLPGGDLAGQLGEELVEGLHSIPSRITPVGDEVNPVAREGTRSPRRVRAVASAAMVASQPLSSADPGSPARSRACSSVSQVRTPLPTGFPASSATRVSPAVTESQTYSKCGVPPRTTTPRATTASCRSVSAWATTGSSTAPGARTTVGRSTPQARAAATARSSRLSVISACHVVATIPSVRPDASTTCASGAPAPLMSPARRRRGARSRERGRRAPPAPRRHPPARPPSPAR